MPSIDGSALPELPVEFMNRDHLDAVEMANALDEILDEGEVEAITEALEDLVEHTREHFLREEDAMREVGFPAYPMHKAEHDRVLGEIDDVLAQWTRSGDREELASWLRGGFPSWLIDHIQTMDTVTAAFLARAGM